MSRQRGPGAKDEIPEGASQKLAFCSSVVHGLSTLKPEFVTSTYFMQITLIALH